MRTRFTSISTLTNDFKLIISSTTSSSWLLLDLAAMYRPNIKWGPDLLSHVLQAQLISNFVTLSDMLGWQKNFINGVIMTVTWPSCNLQADTKLGPDLIFQALVVLLKWRYFYKNMYKDYVNIKKGSI